MHYLVTAGPTREPIDPVRFLSNRSSGRMGYAVARAAARRGHTVQLVSGPVTLPAPEGAERIDVESAEAMCGAVLERIGRCQVLVMAAAVADWRPARVRLRKWKKAGRSAATLDLVRTPDILHAVAARPGARYVVGFAAETEDLEVSAARKLRDKDLDLIVANDVSQPDAGFGVDTNRVLLLHRDGRREAWPLLTKDEVAERLITVIDACCNPA